MNTMKVPYIEGIETMSFAGMDMAMETGAAKAVIGHAGWEEYPYRPSVTFSVARSRTHLAVLYHVRGLDLRATAMEDNGNVWEDSCCEMFISDPSDGTYYPYSAGSLLGYFLGSVPYDSNAKASGFVNDHYLPYIDSANTPVATGFKSLDASALPFMMYQKVYRSNYIDPNLMSNGTVESQVWFPDDIDSSDWRISYSADNLGGDYNQFFVPMHQTVPSSPVANFVPIPKPVSQSLEISDTAVNLTQLRYAMYTDDMFTTALPFLQRGSETIVDLSKDFGLDFSTQQVDATFNYPRGAMFGLYDYSVSNAQHGAFDLTKAYLFSSDYDGSVPAPEQGAAFYASVTGGLSFSAQQLRSLIALSVWQERNALTNGSYGQFVKVHFDKYPNNQYCEPIYIGGTTSYFNVNAVVQTSASVEGSTPQGNPSGIGGSSNNQRITTFRASDWGLILVLCTVIPDTFYVQTQDHLFFDEAPDDFYMPEFEQLSYQPILNKQLFVSGNAETDDDLFGYSNRYVYLKQRDSIARGRIGLPASIDAYYHSYVQSRVFEDTPKLSQSFVTVYPPNIDRSMLAYDGEPAFIVQFYSGVNAVRPMSYVARPNTFGF